MKELMIIEINDQGNFEKCPEKIFYVSQRKTIMFQFIGRKYANYTPILLSNYGNTQEKKFQVESAGERPKSLEELRRDFNIFEGDYEDNLNWSCKVTFERAGLYFFQVAFTPKEALKQAAAGPQDIIICQCFEYIIVNPSFKSEVKTSVDKLAPPMRSSVQLDRTPIKHSSSLGRRTTQTDHIQFYTQELVGTPDISNQSSRAFSFEETPVKDGLPMEYVKFDGLNLITLFPTMMGPIEEWAEELQYLINRGYRAFHFSPIQLLGASRSLYCIRDSLVLNPDIFGVG